MIFVDRMRVPEPPLLRRRPGSAADREYQAALHEMQVRPDDRQRARKIHAYRHPDVRIALLELFNHKCCYCETPLESGSFHIEQFRPKDGVVTADKKHLPDHYWWLANEWRNLYASCAVCNVAKSNRFPLQDEASRAPLLTPYEELHGEQLLLLDPCRPEVTGMLIFLPDGSVGSSSVEGNTTIETLHLNRASLLTQRRELAQDVGFLVKQAAETARRFQTDKVTEEYYGQFERMMSPAAPYSAAAAQLIFAALAGEKLTFAQASYSDHFVDVSDSDRRQARSDLQDFRKSKEEYSLEADEDVDKYLESMRQIERIRISNLGPIGAMTFRVAEPRKGMPWLMLLGENAVGKSTILKAIALALVGEKYFAQLKRKLGPDLAGLVRKGSELGEIAIHIAGSTEPRRMTIFRNGNVEFSGKSAQIMLLAYGSSRLLPRNKAKTYGKRYARVDNIFDPLLPLVDAEQWLLEADDERFDYASRGLKRMLDIDEPERFGRDPAGFVYLTERGSQVPLTRLCDGYQTVIALFADILEVVMRTWPTPEMAEGLVLLDEVGTHLHPSWKLKFVAAMRSFFPRMQVIATTHEPLCLRGLDDGEIAVLRKGPRGGIQLVENLPSIRGMRIDQILTSEHFGLGSTLDPELDAFFGEYHSLLRKSERSDADRERLRVLQAEINQRQRLGETERERRMLEAIDLFMAERAALAESEELAERESALTDTLRQIWLETPAAPLIPAS